MRLCAAIIHRAQFHEDTFPATYGGATRGHMISRAQIMAALASVQYVQVQILKELQRMSDTQTSLQQAVAALRAAEAAESDVVQQVLAYVKTIPAQLTAAVDAALAAGADPESLVGLNAAIDTIKADTASMAAAVPAPVPA